MQEQKADINEKIRDLYDRKDEAREKFLNMHEHNKQKEIKISATEARLEQLRQDYEPYKAQEDMNLFFGIPQAKRILADSAVMQGYRADDRRYQTAIQWGIHILYRQTPFARTQPRFQCKGCQTAIIQRAGQSGQVSSFPQRAKYPRLFQTEISATQTGRKTIYQTCCKARTK